MYPLFDSEIPFCRVLFIDSTMSLVSVPSAARLGRRLRRVRSSDASS